MPSEPNNNALPLTNTHEIFMREALREAKKAFDADEVPVGAIIVFENKIIARAHNFTELLTDPTAHAEMQVITAATHHFGFKYLNQCTLYVTLEPCMMCTGAIFWSQLAAIVYGAPDPKRGFLSKQNILLPKTTITGSVLAEECSLLLKQFFQNKR
jgi:tRNA(adenine34) deaminase